MTGNSTHTQHDTSHFPAGIASSYDIGNSSRASITGSGSGIGSNGRNSRNGSQRSPGSAGIPAGVRGCAPWRLPAAIPASLLAALLFAGCAGQREQPAVPPGATAPSTPQAVSPAGRAGPPPAPATPALPAADPFTALFEGRADGTAALRIGDDALIAITVRRGGVLARLGHDHVMAARRIEGYADPRQGRVALRFRVDELSVDEAALRQEAGLATQPSADDIAGTRHNMLAKVLEAERYPVVEVRARRIAGDDGHLQADITLHGVTRRYTVPVSVDRLPDGVLARGSLALNQSDFGITPYAVLGGALAVQDGLAMRFAIAARVQAPGGVR